MTLICKAMSSRSRSVRKGNVSRRARNILGLVHPAVYGFSSSSGFFLAIFSLFHWVSRALTIVDLCRCAIIVEEHLPDDMVFTVRW